MASIIDNKNKTMVAAIRAELEHTERVDISTAYFYFSGFDMLANELKDKKIRILVGKSIDPEQIKELCLAVKANPAEDLSTYGVHGHKYNMMNNSQKKQYYLNSFVGMFNQSSLSEYFDSTENQDVFKMFMAKIEDGTLEIRLAASQDHGKYYLFHYLPEYNLLEAGGSLIMGSSNFTYNGLLGQGEINEQFESNEKYLEYCAKFEEQWNDSKAIDISISGGNTDFLDALKKRLWIYAKPTPFQIYTRILYELFNNGDQQQIRTPFEITHGKFDDFLYQLDAIKYAIDCINKNDGIIVADVVGLGKSVIASAIARNLDMDKTVIITPPHLMEQWDDYQQEFGLRGVKVYSSGQIETAYEHYANDDSPILYIIDEAHRYRNELSDRYQWLHQLTRSNPKNKVILLTATPYNNRPHDLFAMVKLFQTPSHSTLNTVDNLGMRFHDLIAQYNKLAKTGKKDMTEKIKDELRKLSAELRQLISPVLIRRSRLDLQKIKAYADDLESQNIHFPTVVGPNLVQYDLGEIETSYLATLSILSEQFTSARYNPTSYLHDIDAFEKEYGELFNGIGIKVAQDNLAKFIKRLLVMRFESSKAAFKSTLESILYSYENITKWWDKGYVPIKKRGYLDDPDDDEILETLEEIESLDQEPIDVDKIKKKAIPIPKELFRDEFIQCVQNDITLLQTIYEEWFGPDQTVGEDPKYNTILQRIRQCLSEMPNRKVVVFSSYSDTATYVQQRLVADGMRAILYTGSSSKQDREIVKYNFDASYPIAGQKNDYDIIVATDALSEGFNLNRAGVIINYDIPYNPTRVVQRIGRINRINKKMFDQIYIYNFFPTDIGEKDILIKGISTLKMFLINNIVGSDTRTLTPDETLESYFKTQYEDADATSAELSWDVEYRNEFNIIKNNNEIMKTALTIPPRARIIRHGAATPCAISFAKRGDCALFALAYPFDTTAAILPPEEVLCLFKALSGEPSFAADEIMDQRFKILRDEFKKTTPKIAMTKQKKCALDNLEKLMAACPAEKDYLMDLIDTIQKYDDLSDGELKYLKNLVVKASNAAELVVDIKTHIPSHYIDQIKTKVEGIDAQVEVLMFTEDLRYDN